MATVAARLAVRPHVEPAIGEALGVVELGGWLAAVHARLADHLDRTLLLQCTASRADDGVPYAAPTAGERGASCYRTDRCTHSVTYLHHEPPPPACDRD